jgi:hypothetical protein
MELENIILSEVSQAQKTRIVCSPSYANFRFRANTVMWSGLGHTDLPYDPAILLLGIYLKECDTDYSKGTCTPMFITALFIISSFLRLCLTILSSLVLNFWTQVILLPRSPKYCGYRHSQSYLSSS